MILTANFSNKLFYNFFFFTNSCFCIHLLQMFSETKKKIEGMFRAVIFFGGGGWVNLGHSGGE